MQKNVGSTHRGSKQGTRTLATLIAGAIVPIAIDSLKPNQFTMHHGVNHEGKQINSLGSIDIGNKTVILAAGGQKHGYDTAEFDLMAMQRLQAKGFTVTPPSASTS